ncbi:DUF2071 domain-containing protein [Pseudonocardia sp. K10HN5]|uniref:DUF2071 domain-containing protein n=2 Tax=Pseudonocardia acidicola TaxID=2724939 RepID=A0ABX1SMC4_9PSEU|nr:DUF2071 domain-containing protein [Pseudonocardia acidicola]NMI01674.1 DUF2071 domain-containing protein [Pseudonocardia acidicola]
MQTERNRAAQAAAALRPDGSSWTDGELGGLCHPSPPDVRAWPPVLEAAWLKLTFVHWPFRPADVQRLLPRGLLVDEFDDMAWVSLTPLLMAGVRPAGVSVAPRSTTFPETNLRTYVRRPDGRDGVWLLSLEVASAVMLTARYAVGAPYHLGDLSVSEHGGALVYAGARRGGEPSYHLVIRPGERIQPSDRDIWLTSRWRGYTRRFGILFETPVEHEPWPLSTGVIEQFSETLANSVGLPAPAGEPVVPFSEGVRNVRLGASRPLLRQPAHGTAAGGDPPRPGTGRAQEPPG